ncbi:MAG: S24 family peptidase [Amphritea sp.]
MLKFIPLKAQAGITGFESPASEYVQLGLDLGQLLIDHPSATYIGYAEGESMTGDGIFSGDLLIISRAEKVRDQDIIVANLNGTFVCKKVDTAKARLLSSAAGYRPYTLKEGDDFQIEGVVIRSIRLHRPLSKVF